MIKSFVCSLIISIFLSLSVQAEQYVCAYQCGLQLEKICQKIIQRSDDGFTVENKAPDWTVAENEKYIALSRPAVGPDSVDVSSLIIDKETLEFTTAVTFMEGKYHQKGNCAMLP